MGKILVFKTASDEVMDQLFQKLCGQGSQVYCLVPSGMIKKYKEIYTEAIFPDLHTDSLLDGNLEPGMLAGMHFEEIYVPSSSPYFRNYEELFFFIEELDYKWKILYDCYGNVRRFPYKSKGQKGCSMSRPYFYSIFLHICIK